ncbi:MAG: hypothetical protein AAF443_01535 [Chlamydiota bacterium]
MATPTTNSSTSYYCYGDIGSHSKTKASLIGSHIRTKASLTEKIKSFFYSFFCYIGLAWKLWSRQLSKIGVSYQQDKTVIPFLKNLKSTENLLKYLKDSSVQDLQEWQLKALLITVPSKIWNKLPNEKKAEYECKILSCGLDFSGFKWNLGPLEFYSTMPDPFIPNGSEKIVQDLKKKDFISLSKLTHGSKDWNQLSEKIQLAYIKKMNPILSDQEVGDYFANNALFVPFFSKKVSVINKMLEFRFDIHIGFQSTNIVSPYHRFSKFKLLNFSNIKNFLSSLESEQLAAYTKLFGRNIFKYMTIKDLGALEQFKKSLEKDITADRYNYCVKHAISTIKQKGEWEDLGDEVKMAYLSLYKFEKKYTKDLTSADSFSHIIEYLKITDDQINKPPNKSAVFEFLQSEFTKYNENRTLAICLPPERWNSAKPCCQKIYLAFQKKLSWLSNVLRGA